MRCWGGRSTWWCCELLGEAQSRKNSKVFLELGGGQSPKNKVSKVRVGKTLRWLWSGNEVVL